MIIILILTFLVIGVVSCFVNREESKKVSLLLLSLSITMSSVVIYISKKGGIADEFIPLFFINRSIRDVLRYLPITLKQLGMFLVIGRTLFPYFLLEVSMVTTLSAKIRSLRSYTQYILFISIGIIILYVPTVFDKLVESPILLKFILICVNTYLVSLVIFSMFIVYYELFSIEVPIYKKQFWVITISLTCLSVLYIIYFIQEPGQIYYFYSSNYIWQQGVYYLRALLPIRLYYILIIVTFICMLVGVIMAVKYIYHQWKLSKKEVFLTRQEEILTPATSMLIHGLKNQLITQQILVRRIENELSTYPEINNNLDTIQLLSHNLDEALFKINSVYKSLQKHTVILKLYTIEDIINEILRYFSEKYPSKCLEIEVSDKIEILADIKLLSEAIAHLLINGYEAIQAKQLNDAESHLKLKIYQVRALTVIEVEDNGIGMSEEVKSKVFTPFYSNKNSSYNWGMGLYFVRGIIKDHFGEIYCDSKPNKGTIFTIYLPKYTKKGVDDDNNHGCRRF